MPWYTLALAIISIPIALSICCYLIGYGLTAGHLAAHRNEPPTDKPLHWDHEQTQP